MNLISKLSKETRGSLEITNSKNLILRVIMYFNKANFPHDLVMNSLRLLHNCCKTAPNFREICLDTHGFTLKTFDTIVTDSRAYVRDSIAKQEWETLINACSLISALSDVFPERQRDFEEIIVPLINIVKEKVDAVRKSAAVCLAKISRDEENAKVLRANHGTEVLVSLGGALTK